MRSLKAKIYHARHDHHGGHWDSHESLAEQMIEELGIPATLSLLLEEDMREFKMKKFFYLELKHECKGFFPLVVNSTKQIVVTVDLDLLGRIWKMLTPPRRPSKIIWGRGCFNERLGVVYPVTGTSEHDFENSTPCRVIGEQELKLLVGTNYSPFSWAIGIITGSMDTKEYHEMIEENINKIRFSS